MAGLGRFLTRARLEEQLAGEQPYVYALSNPVTYTDPSGLGDWDWNVFAYVGGQPQTFIEPIPFLTCYQRPGQKPPGRNDRADECAKLYGDSDNECFGACYGWAGPTNTPTDLESACYGCCQTIICNKLRGAAHEACMRRCLKECKATGKPRK